MQAVQVIQTATLLLSLLFITLLAVVEVIQIVLLVHRVAVVVVAQETAVWVALEQPDKATQAELVEQHMVVAAVGLVPLVLRVVFLEAKAVLVRHHPLLARLLHTAAVAVVAAGEQQAALVVEALVLLIWQMEVLELLTQAVAAAEAVLILTKQAALAVQA